MFVHLTSSVTRAAVGTVGMAFCAGLCLIGATAPAHAETVVTRSQAVTYADLDLARPEGRAMLDRRIRVAARTVCATDSSADAARMAEYRCINHAVAVARMKAANAPLQSAGL